MTFSTTALDSMNKCLIEFSPTYGCLNISGILIVLFIVGIFLLLLSKIMETQSD